MKHFLSSVTRFFDGGLWEPPNRDSGRFMVLLITALRLLYKIGQEFQTGQITMRASSLVYTTLLTLVPFLAISFSVLKALGVHNIMEPFLMNLLAPLGERGAEITMNIVRYVQKMKVGLLGSIGLAILVYTVTSTVQQIEGALNYLWQIKGTRPFIRRVRDYLSVVLVGPLLAASALGIGTSLMSSTIAKTLKSIEPFGTAIFFLGKLSPYFLISLSFTLIYYLLPNTRVNFRSAVVGGVSAGTLWVAGGGAFAYFVVSFTKYSAIYSGLAILLLLILWLYYNWLILLTGAKVSFYHQFPCLLSIRDEQQVFSDRFQERLALVIMYLIGDHYFRNEPRWDLNALIRLLRLPAGLLEEILNGLEKRGLIVRLDAGGALLPARDIETITVREVMQAVREDVEQEKLVRETPFAIPEIDRIMREIDAAVEVALHDETIKRLVISRTPRGND